MKPPVEAPTSRQTRPVGIDPERVERGRELVPAAADVRIGRVHADRRRGIHEVAGLAVEPRRVALPHPHLAGHHERLRAAARLGQPALDEQLVEPDALRLRAGGRGRRHPPIVAQPAARGRMPAADVARCACRCVAASAVDTTNQHSSLRSRWSSSTRSRICRLGAGRAGCQRHSVRPGRPSRLGSRAPTARDRPDRVGLAATPARGPPHDRPHAAWPSRVRRHAVPRHARSRAAAFAIADPPADRSAHHRS